MNIINFFKFLEDKKGIPIPFMLKLIHKIPLTQKELTHRGDLELLRKDITELPEGFTVEGYLYISDNTSLTSLPDNLSVSGYLILPRNRLKNLPKGLKVGQGFLCSYQQEIEEIPGDLEVGSLDISDCTGIRVIPSTVKFNSLDARYSGLTSFLHPGTELESVILTGTQITSLPENLTVKRSLSLASTPIKNLPKGLKVRDLLNLENTKIEQLPRDLEVNGKILLGKTPLAEKYTYSELMKMCPKVKGRFIGVKSKS